MNTLLLDDDPFVLKLVSLQLRALRAPGGTPLDVIECQSAARALELLESGHRDIGLVICDLQMPDIDGVEVVRHLVRIGYRGAIVLISGEDQRTLLAAERLARSHKLRVLGAFRKPLVSAQFEAILAQSIPEPSETTPEEKYYAPVEIETAIERGELINYYQPKVDMRSGRVTGMEALVRWMHPTDGLVMPYRFVPIAERYDLMDALTEAVISNAVAHSARWSRSGCDVNIAVNISLSNLRSLDFPDALARRAQAVGMSLDKLTLEVTEGQIMTEPRSQLDVLTRLRLKHVRLSIDDFGMGYSCMAQLRDLPFDELKIDRSFVHGAGVDPSLRAILEASLGLARQLGMTSVAEGIEDQADWDCVRSAGCDLAQGYFISRPMPESRVEAWKAEWESRFDHVVAGAAEADAG